MVTGWTSARADTGSIGYAEFSAVKALLWFDFAGEKNVSMLYFLIIEQRWTDMPMIPGRDSSSSMLTFTSNVLSRPAETNEFWNWALRLETRLPVMRL